MANLHIEIKQKLTVNQQSMFARPQILHEIDCQ